MLQLVSALSHAYALGPMLRMLFQRIAAAFINNRDVVHISLNNHDVVCTYITS